MPHDAHQEVVVITGGSAGVGRATARAFARTGARVAVLARDRERLDATVAELESLGARAMACSVDVADAAAVTQAAHAVEARLGAITVWVNCAMATMFAPLRLMDAEEFARVTAVTYLGSVHGTMAALECMRPRNRGVIVQVSSALAERSIPLQSAYCGAKHAVAGFLDALRSELIHDGSAVHVTAVQLPAINTPQFGWARNRMPRRPQPVPPIFQPEVAARAIVWAAGHRRRTLVMGGPTWLARLGQRVVPGWLDRYLAHAAWDGQQTSEPADPTAADNLFVPLPAAVASRGRFNAHATDRSATLWLARHRNALLATSLLVGAAVGLCWRARTRMRGR